MVDFTLYGKVNTFSELVEGLEDVPVDYKRSYSEDGHYTRKEYLRIACGFDIEVSSFYNKDGDKQSVVYIWMFGLNGKVITGRTQEEFFNLVRDVENFFDLGDNRILPVYIHNLSYEFQFYKDYFGWYNVFAREKRSPMKALTTEGFEFRCSYMLTGCSLEQACKDLVKYKMEKKVGDLDYDLIRTPLTPLTEAEMGYCVYDVLGVMAIIQEEIEHYGSITKIPMTKTGKVREYCREKMFDKSNRKKNSGIIKSLKITGVSEYNMLKRAFQGGFTHANYRQAGKTHYNVKSYDFTSSYPTVMVSEMYPMTSAFEIDIKDVEDLHDKSINYCIMMNVEFDNLVCKQNYESYLSESKCFNISKPVTDNGRIIAAAKLRTTITDVDFGIIERNYCWDNITFGYCLAYGKGYLPTDFVKCVLDFYKDKTTLKDVPGMEAEYLLKKGMLNSCYGMTVTDIVSDLVEYSMGWFSTEPDASEAIDLYNNNSKRFLFYPWGVWITAYARRNLWLGINACKDDYIYSDTDSIKILNADKHEGFITMYNKWITERLERACDFHKIDYEMIRPCTVKGKEKPLGVWDDDGDYLRFKTLGAKRYLVEYEEDGEKHIKCTIAGVNKKKTSKFIEEQKEPFEFFNNNMEVDEEHSGRLIVSYLDEPMHGIVVDYRGIPYEYQEMSGVHMEKSSYHLTMTPMYLALINAKEEVVSV